MTRDQIITKLFTGRNFNDCIEKMEPAHLQDDLKMEVIAVVCAMPTEQIKELYDLGKLEFYTVRIILNMVTNKYSQFFKKFRVGFDDLGNKDVAEAGDIEEREAREEKEDRVIAGIDELYWYDAELVRLYAKHGNYRAIQEETDIPFISCYKTIQRAFKQLKHKACSPSK